MLLLGLLTSPTLWLAACVLLAMALAWAVRGSRAAGPRCPRCRYDMSAAPTDGSTLRCPECGHVARSRAALTARRPRRALAAAALLLLLPALALFGRAAMRAGWHFALLPEMRTIKRVDVGPFVVEILESRNTDSPQFTRALRVRRDGRDLLLMDGPYWELGAQRWVDGAPTNERLVGTDVTGDGLNDLVIVRPTGGSGGLATTFLFTLDPRQSLAGLDPIAVLPDPGRFEDLDRDGVLEYVCGDLTYRYAWTSGAESPTPLVILRWNGSRFVPDLPAMRRRSVDLSVLSAGPAPEPSSAEPSTAESRLKAQLPAVLRAFFDLVYAGRGDEAVALLVDHTEQSRAAGAEQVLVDRFSADLRGHLAVTPFADVVEELNRDQARFRAWLAGDG